MNGARIYESLNPDQTAVTAPATTASCSDSRSASIRTKILFLFFLFTLPLVNPWVRGDGVGYYAYVRSALIDHDLDFENDYLAGNKTFVMWRVDAQGHLLREMYTRTGHVENHFAVGPALFWAPALLTVHLSVVLLDRLGAHIAADGYSRPYLVAMGLTTAFCGFLSLLLSFRMARKYFEERWAFLATLGIWLASALPVYMYFNPSWSHPFSAFSVSLFLWYWDLTKLRRTTAQWAILGILAGLMGNVYYPNALLLVFPALELIYLVRVPRRDPQGPLMTIPQLALGSAAFVAAFLLSLLPTFITRLIIYGSIFETGYPAMSKWNWSSPALLQVLFSADHGLLSWTPILFLAIIGLFFLVRKNFLVGTGAVLTFLAYYLFIASYPDWDGLSSFGNRFFISLTPLFILGLTALLSNFSQWLGKSSRAATVSGTAIALLALWNFGFIFQWGTHMVPARGEISWHEMAHNQVVGVPSHLTRSLQTYFLHRQDMMRDIEQEDLEQLKGNRKPEVPSN